MIFLVADVYVYGQLSIPYGYVSRGHCGLLPESAWKWYKQKHWRPHHVRKSQWFRNPAITNWDVQNLVTNGINYQPQLVNAGFLSWLAGFLNHQHYDGIDFEGPLTVQGMWECSVFRCAAAESNSVQLIYTAKSQTVCQYATVDLIHILVGGAFPIDPNEIHTNFDIFPPVFFFLRGRGNLPFLVCLFKEYIFQIHQLHQGLQLVFLNILDGFQKIGVHTHPKMDGFSHGKASLKNRWFGDVYTPIFFKQTTFWNWNLRYFEKNGEPLFSSHMLDLSEESLEDNISICKKYLERMAKINLLLEMELGVTGGEEDARTNDQQTFDVLIGKTLISFLSVDTVDGSEILHQLRWVVYLPLFSGFYTSQVGCLGFLNHQPYHLPFLGWKNGPIFASFPQNMKARVDGWL